MRALVLLAFAISLALTPCLVSAASYTLKVWTDKGTYQVGQTWASMSWAPDGACLTSKYTVGTITITGPGTRTQATLTEDVLRSGSYTPTLGRPWAASDVGSWEVTLSVTNNVCIASGTATFQVSS